MRRGHGIKLGILLALILVVFSGCSRATTSSDGEPSSKSDPSPDDGLSPPPPGRLSEDTLFYSGGSITAIDPMDPTKTISVEAGETFNEAPLFSGTFHSDTQTIDNIHLHGIIYRKKEDNLFYKVRPGGPVTPEPVSSEVLSDAFCSGSVRTVPDFADPNNGRYFYETGGPDQNCGTESDNVHKMIRFGATSADPAVLTKHLFGEGDTIYDSTTGAIAGFLAIEAGTVVNEKETGTIVHCDADFQTCTDVIPFADREEVLSHGNFGPLSGVVIIQADRNLYLYNAYTKVLSEILFTFPVDPEDDFSIATTKDETDFYFTAQVTDEDPDTEDTTAIMKIPSSAQSPSDVTTLFTEPVENALTIEELRLTSAHLIYNATDSNGDSIMKRLSKSGGDPTVLIQSEQGVGFNIVSVEPESGMIYYNKSSGTTDFISGVIKEDSSAGVEAEDTTWSGRIADRMIRLDGCTFSCSGASVRSFNAKTGSDDTLLGDLPLGTGDLILFGRTNRLLAAGSRTTTGVYDIFYLEADKTGSLVQITDTDDKDEIPIDIPVEFE